MKTTNVHHGSIVFLDKDGNFNGVSSPTLDTAIHNRMDNIDQVHIQSIDGANIHIHYVSTDEEYEIHHYADGPLLTWLNDNTHHGQRVMLKVMFSGEVYQLLNTMTDADVVATTSHPNFNFQIFHLRMGQEDVLSDAIATFHRIATLRGHDSDVYEHMRYESYERFRNAGMDATHLGYYIAHHSLEDIVPYVHQVHILDALERLPLALQHQVLERDFFTLMDIYTQEGREPPYASTHEEMDIML